MTEGLAVRDQAGALASLGQIRPATVLRAAEEVATTIKGVIDRKPYPVLMKQKRKNREGVEVEVVEQYLELEDWQTVGALYGATIGVGTITARAVGDPQPVTMGNAQGFLATAEAVDGQGRVLSRASSYCMNDEEKWSDRTKYGYVYVLKSGGTCAEDPGPDEIIWEDNPDKPGKKRPKKERAKLGMEKVPTFQLASMAQTRANSKALRNVLAWVVVLAGYRPTPAEEMEEVRGAERTTKPANAGASAASRPPATRAASPAPAGQQPAGAPDDAVGRGIVQRVYPPDAEKKPWGIYIGATSKDVDKFTTFSDTVGKEAQRLKGAEAVYTWRIEGGKYKTLVSLVGAAEQPSADAAPERTAEDEALDRELAAQGL